MRRDPEQLGLVDHVRHLPRGFSDAADHHRSEDAAFVSADSGASTPAARDEAVAGTRALGALLTYDEADPAHAYGLLDALLTSAKVVGYVADEVERRTATEGVTFVNVLNALTAAVRGPAERAAVTLLAARAAEGCGDSDSAKRLVHQALADQPDLAPALMDAGEYAVCRGNLREGERYLRRVDHPVAETLLATLRPLLCAPTGTVGRNQTCPCGSGRKYKVCCLTGASHPLDRRAQLFYALLASFAQRSASGEFLGMWPTARWRNDRNRDEGKPVLMDVDWIRQDLGLPATM